MTEGAANPRVVVVVLNWNLPDDTMRCLQTTIPLVQAGAAVVVVDNGSIHERWVELDEAVHKSFPDCVSVTDAQANATTVERGRIGLVRLASNLGYAGGNNVGIRIALNSGAEWVILLNNDCEV